MMRSDNKTPSVFLSAQWRYLAMINYEIDPSVLTPFIPKGTQIDLWNGKAFVSLVGFMFLDTRVKGLSIPFHRNFEEVNLRFYVQYPASDGIRRGVVFIKEIVPKRSIAYLARRLYNENYVALPMCHSIKQELSRVEVEYQWKFNGKWQKLAMVCQGNPQAIQQGSHAEFITEHYWGYSVQRNGETMAYHVEHPRWQIWEVENCDIDVDMENLYGSSFSPFLEKRPATSFLAEGSEVKVFNGIRQL